MAPAAAPNPPLTPTWRARAPFHLSRAGMAAARAVPEPAAVALARALAFAAGPAMPARRAMVARHMQRAHDGGLGPIALGREVQRAFDSYARYWVEAFLLPTLTPELLEARLSYEGVAHLEDALAAGRGAIIAAPHVGAFDFAGAWLAQRGTRVTAVVEDLQPPEMFELFAETRGRAGIGVVKLGSGTGTALLRTLRENGIAVLLCDRDIAGGGVEVEFFGERTTLPAGPATLALRTGAPILPTAAYFVGRKGHHAVVHPPVPAERTGSLRADVTRVTQSLARELEVLIRRAPSQWHLFQPNWPSDRDVLP